MSNNVQRLADGREPWEEQDAKQDLGREMGRDDDEGSNKANVQNIATDQHTGNAELFFNKLFKREKARPGITYGQASFLLQNRIRS